MNPAKPGVLISGLLCGGSRALIVASIIVAGHWGQRALQIGDIVFPAIGSLIIGLIVGAVAGVWLEPRGGALVGGLLSCITSFVTIPVLFCQLENPSLGQLLGLSQPENHVGLLALAIVLITLAGAVSGGVGARYNQQAAMRLRLHRTARYKERFASLPTEYLTATLESGALDAEASEAVGQILRDRQPPGQTDTRFQAEQPV